MRELTGTRTTITLPPVAGARKRGTNTEHAAARRYRPAYSGTAGNDTFTLRTTVIDKDPGVRREAVRIIKQNNLVTGAVDYLARGLMYENPEVRIRTAEAFAELGDLAAVKHMVVAGPSAGRALATADQAVRAHVAFLTQTSYIRDFDVEVASASFIADPRIGVLQEGAVLDVTVVGVEQYRVRITRAFQKSIKDLTGRDPGPDARKWPTWLMRNPLPEAATTDDR